jgi:hypothetical protein
LVFQRLGLLLLLIGHMYRSLATTTVVQLLALVLVLVLVLILVLVLVLQLVLQILN